MRHMEIIMDNMEIMYNNQTVSSLTIQGKTIAGTQTQNQDIILAVDNNFTRT